MCVCEDKSVCVCEDKSVCVCDDKIVCIYMRICNMIPQRQVAGDTFVVLWPNN